MLIIRFRSVISTDYSWGMVRGLWFRVLGGRRMVRGLRFGVLGLRWNIRSLGLRGMVGSLGWRIMGGRRGVIWSLGHKMRCGNGWGLVTMLGLLSVSSVGWAWGAWLRVPFVTATK